MPLQDLQSHSPGNHLYELRDQLKRHVFTRSEAALVKGDQIRDAIKTKAQLKARQAYIRKTFLQCLGHMPSRHTPLNPHFTPKIQGDGFTLQNIRFESRPSHYVTGTLYTPDPSVSPQKGDRHLFSPRPHPAVLYICGHSLTGRLDPAYQDIHIHLAKAGFVVFCQDTQGQGERYAYFDPATGQTTIRPGTQEHEYVGARTFLLDQTLAGSFLHDAMRGIDFLASLPNVDPARIGVTGESGGGTHTSMLMMADPRVAAAAPALFTTSRQAYLWVAGAQDAEQIWPSFTARGLDHEDFLIAMAPRPVNVLAAQYDFFPIEGTRRTVDRARRLYKLAGDKSARNLILSEFPIPHSYPAFVRDTMVAFFSRVLLNRKTYTPPRSVSTFPSSSLHATPSGQLRADFKDAKFAHETNVDRLRELEQERKKIPRAKAIAWLKKQVHSNRSPCEFNVRIVPTDTAVEGFEIQSLLYWSQTHLFNHTLIFRPSSKNTSGKKLPVTLALWDGGSTVLTPHLDFLTSECAQNRAVMVLNVSGAGSIAPIALNARPVTGYSSAMHTLSNNLLWLGDSTCALRTFDVTRALDLIPTRPDLSDKSTRLYAHGRHGLYGRLAALIDPRIKKTLPSPTPGPSLSSIVEAFHYDRDDIQSLVIPGILKYIDL